MPDALVNGSDVSSPVDPWLQPLEGDEPCGPDLEYDPESLELTAATGKSKTQFDPGEAPAWARVRELAQSLLERTRDLRVAVWWGRASLNLDGISALPPTLALLHGLLDRFWDRVHPVPDPDDADMLARLSAIGGLDKLGSLLGDVRNARLSEDRRLNGLRVRDVEVALGKLPARPDEGSNTPGQIQGQLAQAPDLAGGLARQLDASLASVGQLRALMNERFRADLVVDLKSLEAMLTSVRGVLPANAGVVSEDEPAMDSGADTPADAQAPPSVAPPGRRAAGGVHSVESRQDAMRAIELVCSYLERTEPTNPAQLFLRRAGRVIDMNFLQLMDELAPDALKEVARIMGVDPGSIGADH